MDTNREKVIEGLKCCFENAKCDGCPYEIECRKISFKTPENHCPILDDVLSLLEKQEAKTGHWIEKEDYAFDTYYDCSVCGESWSTIEGTPRENGMNYCPHCGAKMEGQVELDDID